MTGLTWLAILIAAMRFMAERAGAATAEQIEGAGDALTVSQPGPVAEAILRAVG
ncbi:hypothetical protein ACFY36_14460 [Actinoplanes sp. NPDC000266]